MTLSTIKPSANDRHAADMMFRYGPPTAALAYPVLLIFLHQSGRHLVEATDPTGKLLAGLAVTFSATLVYGVPLLSFVAILRSADQTTRRLTHLAFAAPPLFTLIGVFFFFVGIANGDYIAWAVAWLGVLAYAASAPPRKAAYAPAAPWIKTAHGITAATILLTFLLWHIGNHVLAMWSLEKHKAVMDLLRLWYRSDLVQPIVVALFLWQLVSGLRLLWSKLPQTGDVYSSIQTATAAYLAIYIPSHLIAVFLLGRWFLGVDTDFAWASGAPTGLLLDPWNVRLIPHYSLAVLFLIGHLAVGLRTVLLNHDVSTIAADRLTWIICSIGLAVSLLVTAAQLSVGR
jgi:hypothetical protein